MKIVYCTSKDIEANTAMNLLHDIFKNHQVTVIYSNNARGCNDNLPSLQFGEQDFINNFLFPLIDENCNGRKILDRIKNNKFLTFNQITKHYNTTTKFFKNINSNSAVEFLRDLEPDLIFSIRYRQIFRDEVISIPKHGIINLHSGMARGLLATFRSMINDDHTLSPVLHYIDSPEIDAGPVIDYSHLKVNKNKSLLWHIVNLYYDAIPMLIKNINKIGSGQKLELSSFPNKVKKTYYSCPNKEDVELFLKKGYKVFDGKEYMELLEKYK